jgi:hypothetical protein
MAVKAPDPLQLAADILDPPPLDVFRLLGYTPDPAQSRFHQATEFDVGYGGLAGAGKSMALVMEGITKAATYPGMRVGAFRRTYDELEESLLSKVMLLQQPLEEHFGARLIGGGRPELRFRNGSVIRFRYAETLQDATRRQGGEYQLVLVDERQQVAPQVVEYLETRIRSGAPGVPVIGIRSSFNPGDIGHADLKERFIDRTGAGARTYQTVDPVTKAGTGRWVRFVPGERSSHIDDGYWARLQAIEDPVLRRQLADGDWDAGGGLMFSETWRRHIHVVTPEQAPIPLGAGVIRARGVDYGMTNPFCCLWGAKLADDLVVVYRELYRTGLTPVEQAELILASEHPDEKRLPLVAHLDPACWTQYANVKRHPGVPAKSIASDYAKAGVAVVKAHNDRIGGVRLVHQALRVQPDGMPRLLVYDTCPKLIKQLGGLPRSKTNPEDVNTAAEDHAYDALRYLLFGLLGRKNTAGDQRSSSLPRPVTAGIRGRSF